MSARHPALLLTTAIMLAIVTGFIVYSSSALGRDALDDLFDRVVEEEAVMLQRPATHLLHTHPLFRCRARLVMSGAGFPVVRKVVICRRGA